MNKVNRGIEGSVLREVAGGADAEELPGQIPPGGGDPVADLNEVIAALKSEGGNGPKIAELEKRQKKLRKLGL